VPFNFSNSAQVTVHEVISKILAQVGCSDLQPIVQDNAPNEISASRSPELEPFSKPIAMEGT
jgi:hypothetical protein